MRRDQADRTQWSVNAAARRRFREAQAAAAISHPHVVTIHAVGEWCGRSYLVMEYISGPSLEQRIRERAAGYQGDSLDWLAGGIRTRRGQVPGLIHRDVKPGNIMLENDLPRVKLTDFGLARAVDDVRLTQQGILAGTPQYMAPNRRRGEPLDRRTDLFSLGSVLCALCTGRPAFVGESTVEVIHRVCDATPPSIQELNPDIPDWLVEIVARLHSKDPSDRFQSTGEVAELLERHLARLQDRSLPPIVHDWTRHPSRANRASTLRRIVRSRWSASVFLVLLGAAITYGLMNFTITAPEPEPQAASNLTRTVAADRRQKQLRPLGGRLRAPAGMKNATSPLREYVWRFGEALDTRHLRLGSGSAAHSSIRADAQGDPHPAHQGGSSPFIDLMYGVKGDFEITATYDVPQEKRAEAAGSIGPSLQIFGDPGANLEASLSRPLRAANSSVEAIYRKRADATFAGKADSDPTRAMTGRLRISPRARS